MPTEPVFSAFDSWERRLVWIGGDAPPSKDEWNIYCDLAARIGTPLASAWRPMPILIITDASAPNAAQRTAFLKIMEDRGIRTRSAVVTSSVIARGIVTVFRSFRVDMKSFVPRDIAVAMEFLDVPRPQHAALWAVVVRLKERLSCAAPKAFLQAEASMKPSLGSSSSWSSHS